MSDMVVCGVVETIVLEDIRFSIPKGYAVTIPSDLVVVSKDLYRALSTGAIFQLNVNSLLAQRTQAAPPTAPSLDVQPPSAELEEENGKLRGEVQRLQGEVQRSQGENARNLADSGKFQAENARLRAENLKLQSTHSKIEGIYELLKERPATVIQQVSSNGSNGGSKPPVAMEDGGAPVFIPSQIRSDNVTASRIAVQEESSESGSVSKASDILRRLKKTTDDQ